jgi:hypothetical protein
MDELTRIIQEADALVISLDDLLSARDQNEKNIPSVQQQSSDELASVLRSQVLEAKLRRSAPHIDAVYSKYAADDRGISHSLFFKSIQEVRFDFKNEGDADALFENMDMDNDGFLNLDEFRRAVQSSSEMEQFISHSISIVEMISAALPRDDSKEPIDVFRMLTPLQITAISNAVSEGLAIMLSEKVAKLGEGFAAAEAKKSGNSAAKFAIFELSAGSVQDYHKGLSSRVGDLFFVLQLLYIFSFVDGLVSVALIYFFESGAQISRFNGQCVLNIA